jgi:hypothetical protein
MNLITKNKGLWGGVVLVVLLVGGYFMFFQGGSGAPTLSSSDQNSVVSQNLLATLQSLHTIKLDDSIFSNPVFVSLQDFGVTIPPENVGRRNPFLPLTGVVTNSSLTLPTH